MTPGFTIHPALEPVARWTPRKKAEVLEALRLRRITITQACEAHDLSAEEIDGWVERFGAYGQAGLSAMRLQELRTQ